MSFNDKVLILNSANADFKDLSNGEARFIMKDPLRLENSVPKLALNTVSFYNFFVNISAADNNNHLFITNDYLNLVKYDITIPDGSYGYEELNDVLQLAIAANNPAGITGCGITINGDASQNKIYFKFAEVGWAISLSGTTPYTLLGCVLDSTFPAAAVSTVANEVHYAPAVAAFDTVTAVNVQTNLSNSIVYGNNYSNILYSTMVTGAVGSNIQMTPANLLWVHSPSLATGVSEIIIRLLNQSGAPIKLSADFLVVLQIQL